MLLLHCSGAGGRGGAVAGSVVGLAAVAGTAAVVRVTVVVVVKAVTINVIGSDSCII